MSRFTFTSFSSCTLLATGTSMGDAVTGISPDMCQTEVVALTFPDGVRLYQSFLINEPRLLDKTLTTTANFLCDDNELMLSESIKSGGIGPCPPLQKVQGTYISEPYRSRVLIPWLETALTTLSSLAHKFTGSRRSKEMIEWLKVGAFHGGCRRLNDLLLRLSSSNDTFTEMVNQLNIAINITPSGQNQAALRNLLAWRSCDVGKNLHIAWCDWLDRYARVPQDMLVGNDSLILNHLRAFLNQTSKLSVFQFMDKVLISTCGKVISIPCQLGDDINHHRLASLITAALHQQKSIFGPTLTLQAETHFESEREVSHDFPKRRRIYANEEEPLLTNQYNRQTHDKPFQQRHNSINDGFKTFSQKIRLVAAPKRNSACNVFPSKFLTLASDVKEETTTLQPFGSQVTILSTHYGTLKFIAPVDPIGNAHVELSGCFVDEGEEVIISRHSMSAGIEMSAGKNYPIVCKLRNFPKTLLGLDENLTQVWSIIPHRPFTIARLTKQKKIVYDSEAITSIEEHRSGGDELQTVQFPPKSTTMDVLSRLHNLTIHPNCNKFKETLKCLGIMVPNSDLMLFYQNCSTCSSKPQGKTHVHTDNDYKWKRGGIAQTDITDPSIKGIHGYKHISVIYDQSTGFVDAEAIKQKDNSFNHILNYLAVNPHISTLRSDNAGEYTSEKMMKTLSRMGVGFECTAPGGSTSVGGAERSNKTIKDKLYDAMRCIGFEDRPELWPWFVKSAQCSINFSYSTSRNAIPSQLRSNILSAHHGRKSIDVIPPPFCFNDVVHFKTPRDCEGIEQTPNGFREGLFLSFIHSGSCEIISPQNEQVVRWIVHPQHVSLGNQKRKESISHHLRWCLGQEKTRFFENIEKPSINLTDEANEHNLTEMTHPFPPIGQFQKLKKKGKENSINVIRGRTQHDQHNKLNNQLQIHRTLAPLSTIVFSHSDADMVAVTIPHKNMITVNKVDDGSKCGDSIIMPVNKTFNNRRRAILLPSGKIHKLTPSKKEVTGRYFKDIGYIAPDEANPQDVRSGSFNLSDDKEWNCLHNNSVMELENNIPNGIKAIKTRFRRTWKQLPGNERKAKTRFVACATNDFRQVDTATEMPASWIRRLGVTFGLSRGWKAATIDIQTAFLLVPLPDDRHIYIQLPSSLPNAALNLKYQPNGIYKLKKSLYGLKESPLLFNEFLMEKLKPLGWNRAFPGVFFHESGDGILMAYVDDILVLSSDPTKSLHEISHIIKCSDLLPVNEEPQRHVGYEITSKETFIFFDIQPYINTLPDFAKEIDQLGQQYCLKPLSPNNLPVLHDETELQVYNPEHIHLFQRAIGALCWLATCHPAICSRHGELASFTHKPSPKLFRILKGTMNELRSIGLSTLSYQKITKPEFRLWVDCAVHAHRGRRGWILQAADVSWPLTIRNNLIHWKSARDRLKHASSTAGEVNAILQALEETADCLSVVSTMYPDSTLRILSDSMSGILQIANGGSTIKSKTTASYINHLLTRLPLINNGIEHVPGEIQLADPLTKVKQLQWYSHYDSTNIMS